MSKLYQTLLKSVKLGLKTERWAWPCGAQCTLDKKDLGGVWIGPRENKNRVNGDRKTRQRLEGNTRSRGRFLFLIRRYTCLYAHGHKPKKKEQVMMRERKDHYWSNVLEQMSNDGIQCTCNVGVKLEKIEFFSDCRRRGRIYGHRCWWMSRQEYVFSVKRQSYWWRVRSRDGSLRRG